MVKMREKKKEELSSNRYPHHVQTVIVQIVLVFNYKLQPQLN